MLWDDNAHITGPELRSGDGLRRIWMELGATQQYYPLLHSIFWFEQRLWGDAPLGYHLANIIEHALSSFLVYKVCQQLRIPGAVLAAFLFALHPVAVESVAWMSEQKNTLSGALYLSAMLAYLHFEQSRHWRTYAMGLALFVMALGTKTVTATLPAVICVVIWWRDGNLRWSRDVLPLLPWLLVGIGAGAFSAHVEHSLIGAQGADFHLSVAEKLLLCGETFWFYVGKAIWPHPLVFIYPRWTDAQIFGAWYALTAAIVVAISLWLLRRKSRAPLATLLIYAGTLFPALGLLNVYPFLFSYVADHFQYLALLALIVPLSAALARAARKGPRRTVTMLGVALCVSCAMLTARQARLYTDGNTLYRSILVYNPDCWMAHNNLGNLYAVHDSTVANAIAEYQAALAIKSDWADTHYNLANVYALDASHRNDALTEYHRAIALQPTFAEAHNNLGKFLAGEGREDHEAAREFETALQIDPHLAAAHANLGTLYSKRPELLAEAAREYRQAVALDPTLATVYLNLGLVLSRIPGSQDEAVASFRRALALREDLSDAHFNLGKLLAAKGDVDEAIAHYERAQALEPDRTALTYLIRDLRAHRVAQPPR